ncbi:MAG TPA: hypothetical protein PLK79_04240, partial [Thermoleophilia bacterium]|nr:hypothetical protein [Thermoleophilia bacterium]HQG04452.1 hypothetical protein [Thermoleophilia bacterium]
TMRDLPRSPCRKGDGVAHSFVIVPRDHKDRPRAIDQPISRRPSGKEAHEWGCKATDHTRRLGVRSGGAQEALLEEVERGARGGTDDQAGRTDVR